MRNSNRQESEARIQEPEGNRDSCKSGIFEHEVHEVTQRGNNSSSESGKNILTQRTSLRQGFGLASAKDVKEVLISILEMFSLRTENTY